MSSSNNTIEGRWLEFVSLALPDSDEYEVELCRSVFYAGVKAGVDLLYLAADDDDAGGIQIVDEMLLELHTELATPCGCEPNSIN